LCELKCVVGRAVLSAVHQGINLECTLSPKSVLCADKNCEASNAWSSCTSRVCCES
jgi:hypothetical protein